MTERALNPEQTNLVLQAFVYKGICPNTGAACEKLGDIQFARRVANDALGMQLNATVEGSERREAITSDYHQQCNRLADLSLIPIKDSAACVGGCALEAVDKI